MTLTEELAAVADRATRLDFKQLPGSEAQDLARELAVTISRLSGARLAALSQVADTGAWAFDGSRSMAHALARTEDAGVGVLKAELRLAEHLDLRLPLTAVALRAGQVSLEQAKVIARWAPTSDLRCAALADPETGEAFLLAKAHLLGVQELTQVTRYWATGRIQKLMTGHTANRRPRSTSSSLTRSTGAT